MSNRMLQLISAISLATTCKVRRIVIMEEPSDWAPGNLADLFAIPDKIPQIGIEAIKIVSLTEEIRDQWIERANQDQKNGHGFLLQNFIHPRHIASTVLEHLQWTPAVAADVMLPMSWLENRLVQVRTDIREHTEKFLREYTVLRGGPYDLKDPALLKIAMHVRLTDMKDTLHGTGEQSRQETDDYVRKLVEAVAENVAAWRGPHGCLVMVAADHVKVRAAVLRDLKDQLDYLQVDEAHYSIVFACTCKWDQHRGREEHPQCKQHVRTNHFHRASLGQIREGSIDDLAVDILMMSYADVLFTVEWSTMPDIMRALKGLQLQTGGYSGRAHEVLFAVVANGQD
jgi:hypothetical protein